METHTLNNLLRQVKAINEHYNKINELSGENFNVFRILKLETSEVRMHSSFIAELLNPKGSHGQTDTFLKLFIKDFCFKNKAIDTLSCKVEVEKHTGKINSDRTEGGRIDIIVTDKFHNQIVIENKIYATDQHNQILRYFKHSPNADLIYLSLDGKEPNDYSKGALETGKDYACKSYSTHVVKWLESCRKEVAILPILRESITLYINLIKYLTNQSLNNTMKTDLTTLMGDHLEASFIIADNIDNTLDVFLEQFKVQLNEVASELQLSFWDDVDIKFKNNFKGFYFTNEKWKHVGLSFQFWGYDKDLTYGFTAMEDPMRKRWPKVLTADHKAQFKSLINFSYKDNDWWPLHLKMEDPYDNWSKYEAWKAIQDGSMKAVFREKILYLLDLTSETTL